MATLTNTKIKDTYVGLLKTTDNQAIDASGVTLVEDGAGNASALSVGRSGNGVSVSGSLGVGASSPTNTIHISADAPSIRLQDLTSSDNHYLTGNNSEFRVQSSGFITMRPGNTTSVTLLENGNVGIGSSPSGTFSVADIGNSGADFIIGQNSIHNYYTSGTNGFHLFRTGTSERMRITSDGKLGLGTSSPSAKIDINGGARLKNDNALQWHNGFGLVTGEILGSGGGYLNFSTGGTERMRITSSGNVGIGTSSPAGKLDVNGSYYIKGDEILANDGANNYIKSNAALYFQTNAGTQAMIINSSQNIGIGTSSPDTMLHISDTLGNAVIRLERNDTAIVNGDTYGAIEFEGQDANAGASGVRGSIKGEAEASNGQLSLVFSTAAGNSANAERMRITSDGYLRMAGAGIQFNGDTSSANALDDYEEGTWTPTITFGGSDVGITYNINSGTYTKIGRQVTVNGFIQLSNKGSSTGNVSVLGLPFTIGGLDQYYTAAAVRIKNVSFANAFMGLGVKNQAYFNIEEITEAGVVTRLTDAEFTNPSEIIVSMTYFIS